MKTNELDDLKQFITAMLSQTETRLGERIDQLENRIDTVAAEMHDGFAGIADIIEGNNKRVDDHEQRVTKLEQQAV